MVISVDGADYYLAGAPDGPGGTVDIPGHYWILNGDDRLQGKHHNSSPFGAPQWWSSDAPDGELLYLADGIVDTWTPEKAASYSSVGFVHYHELHPELAHAVSPGIDYAFIPNWMVPYPP